MHVRVAVNFASKITFALISIITIPVIKSKLGVNAYGVLTFFLSIQVVILLLEGGMSATMARGLLNKKYKIYNISKAEYQSVYFIFFILVSLFVFSIFIVFNHNISTLIYNLDDREVYSFISADYVILLAGAMIALQFYIIYYEALFVAYEKQVSYGIHIIVFNVIKTIISLFLLIVFNLGLDVCFLVHVFCTFILIILLHIKAIKNGLLEITTLRVKKIYTKISFMKEEFHFSKNILCVSILSAIAFQADRLFITKYMGISAVGMYGIAYTLSTVPTLFTSSLYNVIYPRLIILTREQSSSAISFFELVSKLIYIIIIPTCVIISLNSTQILNIWIGKHEGIISLLLSILIIATLFQGLQVIPFALQMAQERLKFTVFMNAIFVPSLILAYYLVSIHKILLYISIVWSVYNIITFFSLTIYLYAKNKMYTRLLILYFNICLCAVVTVVICSIFKNQESQIFLSLVNISLQFFMSMSLCIILLFWKTIYGALRCVCCR
ncbi:O3 family O-antigen flippase [Escherichia coli]|nr:O3 family O-antigen flippase [Escherichia coli]